MYGLIFLQLISNKQIIVMVLQVMLLVMLIKRMAQQRVLRRPHSMDQRQYLRVVGSVPVIDIMNPDNCHIAIAHARHDDW